MMSHFIQISTAFVVAMCCSTINGCDWSPIKNPDSSDQVCFLVLDDLTSQPLRNVKVKVWELAGIRFSGITDASGIFCFTSHPGDYATFFSISADGYISTLFGTCGGPRCTLRLEPAAFVRLHIKNSPPTAPDDRLLILWPNPNFLVGKDSLDFHGSDIDTLITKPVRSGITSVTWWSWHNSVISDSTTITIFTAPRDTSFLEVLY